jgi:glycosyltransferase involved in cell wall biosynthesis
MTTAGAQGTASGSRQLRVGICVRNFAHTEGKSQVLLGLVHALGRLHDGPEHYLVVVQSPRVKDWLEPYRGPNQEVIVHPHLGERSGSYQATSASVAKAVKNVLAPALKRVQHTLSPARHWPEVPLSDGFFESLRCDVVHFPQQWFMVCNIRSVYNPHDLQHLVHPHYMSQSDFVWSEVLSAAGCRFAHTVVAGTQWVKEDIVKRYGTDPDKIQVIPWASPTEFYSEPKATDLTQVLRQYRLEQPFAILPANTWKHKNHVRLLEAIAYLRDTERLTVRLVCTGGKLPQFWPEIETRMRELRLENQVKFLGTVSDADLRALYRLSQFLVMPTLYEADSNPIHEAWFEDVPVASSNCTALPDQVKDAGLLFDPTDVRAIAAALARMSTDAALREELKQRGRRRAKDFSWDRTAKAFRASYRRAADFPLTEEDKWLLQWDWLRDPHRVRPSVEPQTVTS